MTLSKVCLTQLIHVYPEPVPGVVKFIMIITAVCCLSMRPILFTGILLCTKDMMDGTALLLCHTRHHYVLLPAIVLLCPRILE